MIIMAALALRDNDNLFDTLKDCVQRTQVPCKFMRHVFVKMSYLLTTHYMNVLLLQCYFRKNGYDFNACNNVREILYNTDVITSIVKLIIHSPVGKLL